MAVRNPSPFILICVSESPSRANASIDLDDLDELDAQVEEELVDPPELETSAPPPASTASTSGVPPAYNAAPSQSTYGQQGQQDYSNGGGQGQYGQEQQQQDGVDRIKPNDMPDEGLVVVLLRDWIFGFRFGAGIWSAFLGNSHIRHSDSNNKLEIDIETRVITSLATYCAPFFTFLFNLCSPAASCTDKHVPSMYILQRPFAFTTYDEHITCFCFVSDTHVDAGCLCKLRTLPAKIRFSITARCSLAVSTGKQQTVSRQSMPLDGAPQLLCSLVFAI